MWKRKAEGEAEKEEELVRQHKCGDNGGEEKQERDDETSHKNWNTPGESPLDGVLPTSMSTPEQLAVVVPLQTKKKYGLGVM